ncbi:hypothetical protein NSK_000377 [Nannochloropsis salina CCMP1776]|uniref:WHIM2 domain-containing protein n=1 Tax=Nannochloropsis salina CCMP1776 TaxID=1027361 RepID=A0A4D9DD30_9STRA|nr:hypothetical protein NSK_000377 [Nannochloropsis salina CCMP1776]|eukprot:TFJ88023.1 hypothetical protein NSK_000377 [Nannochloropsis salina CCMP1776]
MVAGADVGTLNQLARENEMRLAKRRERERLQRKEKKARSALGGEKAEAMSAAAVGAMRGGREEGEEGGRKRERGSGEEEEEGGLGLGGAGHVMNAEEATGGGEVQEHGALRHELEAVEKRRAELERKREAKVRRLEEQQRLEVEVREKTEEKGRTGVEEREGRGGGGGLRRRSMTPTAAASPREGDDGGGGKKKVLCVASSPSSRGEREKALTPAELKEQQEEIKQWTGELRRAKKGFQEMQEKVLELRQAREKEGAEWTEVKRRWQQSQTRFENYHRHKEELLLLSVKDDLETLVEEGRRGSRRQGGGGGERKGGRGGGAGRGGSDRAQTSAGPVLNLPPPSVLLTSPSLPSRAIPDLMEVTHFVRELAKPLGLQPFSLLHLHTALTRCAGEGGTEEKGAGKGRLRGLVEEYRAVPSTLPPPGSGRGGDKVGKAEGRPSRHFLSHYFLSFLRLIFHRHVVTGEAKEGEEGGPRSGRGEPKESAAFLWNLTRFTWAELLNPLTLPEIARRFLVAKWWEKKNMLQCPGPPEGKVLVELFEVDGGYCPFGESFLGNDAMVVAATEALRCLQLESLGAEYTLSLLRALMEEVQDVKAVQDFIQTKAERLLNLSETKNEVEKEMRKLNREMKKLVMAAKAMGVEGVGRGASAGSGGAGGEGEEDEGGEDDEGGGKGGAEEEEGLNGKDVSTTTGTTVLGSPEVQRLNSKIQKVSGQLKAAREELGLYEREFARARSLPLGEDRYRNQYWYYEEDPRLYVHLRSGMGAGREGGGGTGLVLPVRAGQVLEPPPGRAKGGEWGAFIEEEGVKKLMASLCGRAWREGQLLRALEKVREPLLEAMRRAEGYRMREGEVEGEGLESRVKEEEGSEEKIDSLAVVKGEEVTEAMDVEGGEEEGKDGKEEDGEEVKEEEGEGGTEKGQLMSCASTGENSSSTVYEEPRRSTRRRNQVVSLLGQGRGEGEEEGGRGGSGGS